MNLYFILNSNLAIFIQKMCYFINYELTEAGVIPFGTALSNFVNQLRGVFYYYFLLIRRQELNAVCMNWRIFDIVKYLCLAPNIYNSFNLKVFEAGIQEGFMDFGTGVKKRKSI